MTQTLLRLELSTNGTELQQGRIEGGNNVLGCVKDVNPFCCPQTFQMKSLATLRIFKTYESELHAHKEAATILGIVRRQSILKE